MNLLVWLAVGAICGWVWSRRMANSTLADVAAAAAFAVLGGLLVFVAGWSGDRSFWIADLIAAALFALVGLSIWRIAIGRRI